MENRKRKSFAEITNLQEDNELLIPTPHLLRNNTNSVSKPPNPIFSSKIHQSCPDPENGSDPKSEAWIASSNTADQFQKPHLSSERDAVISGALGGYRYSSYSVEKSLTRKKRALNLSQMKELRALEEEIVDSSLIVGKTKVEGSAQGSFGSSYEEAREKGKAILHPCDDTVNYLSTRRDFSKSKHDAGTCARSLRLRNKHIKYYPDGGASAKLSKSRSGLYPVSRKKRCSNMKSRRVLPLDDFIQQQQAYFQQVDTYELLEEEVSQDESS